MRKHGIPKHIAAEHHINNHPYIVMIVLYKNDIRVKSHSCPIRGYEQLLLVIIKAPSIVIVMQQTVGRSVRYGRTAGRVPYVVLFAFFAWTWCPVPTGGLVKCIAAATVVVNVPNKDDRISDWTDDGDDRTFDWSIDEDDEDDDDDDVRSAAAAVLQQLDDDVYAGKMMAFFAKLNSLRRKHHEERRRKPESSFEPERHVPATASRPPHGDDPGIRVNDDLLLQQQKLSSLPPSTNTNRDRKYGFWPGIIHLIL